MNRALEERFGAWYHINGDDMTGSITIGHGWDGFAAELNIVEGSVLLVKVDVHGATDLVLDFIEVLNP